MAGNLTPNKFYVYIHYRNDNGLPFYVGKGSGRRANSTYMRSKHWQNIVAKAGYTVRILQNNMSEDAAFRLELRLTHILGTDTLTNVVVGGGGCAGMVHTPETRRLMSLAQTGRVATDEARANMSRAQKGHTYSEETLAKYRARRPTEETRQKMRLAHQHKGPISEATRMKISTANTGKVRTPEMRQRLRDIVGRRVLCVETGIVYNSGTDAAQAIGRHKSAVCKALTGGHKCGGLTFRYID